MLRHSLFLLLATGDALSKSSSSGDPVASAIVSGLGGSNRNTSESPSSAISLTSSAFSNSSTKANPTITTPTNAAYSSAFSCNQALASYDKAASSFSSSHNSTTVFTTTGLSTFYQEEFGFEVTYTGVNITLYNGHPRAASDTFNATKVTSFSNVITSTLYSNYTAPSPTCSLDIPACDLLQTQYLYELEASQSKNFTAQPTWSPQCQGSCGPCSIGAYNAQLLYWPVSTSPSAITDYCAKTKSTITPKPTGIGPNTAYYKSYTLTSPSVYIIVSGVDGLAMQNEGPCGPSIAETIISLAPESLSTARGAKNDPYPFDFSDLNHAIVNGSKIPLVPWDAYQGMFWCWDFGGCPVILDNYRPYISNPPQLLDLDPHWSTCSLFTGAIFDPPIALSTAAILDAPMPKTTSNKPSMTYHTTKAPAPGHTRSTTILPATTPIADSKPMPTPGSGNGGGNSGSGGGSNSDGRPGSHSGSGGLGSGGVGDSGSNNNGGLVGALTSAILGAASARPTAVAHGGGFGDSGQSGSGSGSGGDHAAPVPIATIGSHTVFSNPSGSGGSSNDGGPGGIIIDGHTFSAGDSGTTIGGVAISVGSSGLEVASGDAKTQTIAIPGSGSGLATLPPVITIGSSKITASINEVSGTAEPFYEIGGRTLTPGGTVTLGSGSSATTVALPNANNAAKPLIVVINGRTSTLAPEVVPITADTGASDERELITVAGTTYTANSVDQFVITDKDGTVHTLVPGKGTQTIDGTPIALLPGGLAVIGSSTASLSEVKVDPTNRGGSGRSSTAKSTLTTAEEGSSTYVPLASSTSGAAAGTGVGTPAWLPLVAAIGMLQLT